MVQNVQDAPRRPRGRPRKFDEAEVAERMRDVFWKNGYSGTSLDDLVAASHVNRPSLYSTFGNKHAIYLQVLEENRISSIEGIERQMTGNEALSTSLRNFLTASADSTLAGDEGARGCFIVCTAVTEALKDEETRVIAARYVEDVDRVFRERFERSLEELNVGVDPVSAAGVASAMLQTLAIRARTGSSREDLLSIVEAAVTVICRPAGGPIEDDAAS